jgi:uncharacterized membrane protein
VRRAPLAWRLRLHLAAVFVVSLWLGVVAKDFYKQQLADYFAERVNWTAAIVFYLMFVAGVMTFVVVPAVTRQSLAYAAGYGLLFGLFTYGTYDLTNLATLRNWPLKLLIVDICWGMFLSTAVASASYLIARRLL